MIVDFFMEEIVLKEFFVFFFGVCLVFLDDCLEYVDVCDYYIYSVIDIEDVVGNDMGLDGYGVSVEVVVVGSDILIIDNNDVLKVMVMVFYFLGDVLVVISYRMCY